MLSVDTIKHTLIVWALTLLTLMSFDSRRTFVATAVFVFVTNLCGVFYVTMLLILVHLSRSRTLEVITFCHYEPYHLSYWNVVALLSHIVFRCAGI